MHALCLVTVRKRRGWDNTAAIEHVQQNAQRKRVWRKTGMDWFLVGGRWSGWLLRQTALKEAYEEAGRVEAASGISFHSRYPDGDFRQELQKELRKEVRKVFKQACPPQYKNVSLERDSYQHADDDALLIDQTLYDKFLKEHEGKKYHWDAANFHLYFLDMDGEEVSKKFIGRKYLVVVDYHW